MSFTQKNVLVFNGVGGIQDVPTATVNVAGSAANMVPQTDNTGHLDVSVIPAASIGGVGAANEIAQLNSGGTLDPSLMPPGITPAYDNINATENIPAGSAVQVFNNLGVPGVRRADAASAKVSNGFVLVAGTTGNPVTVYYQGRITGLSGLLAGPVFLGSLGAFVNTPPGGVGSIIQPLGEAASATEVNFLAGLPTVLNS